MTHTEIAKRNAAIRKEYLAGEEVQTLAARHAVSYVTVYAALKQAPACTLRPRQFTHGERAREILARAAAYERSQDIADTLQVSRQYVSAVLRQAGVRPKELQQEKRTAASSARAAHVASLRETRSERLHALSAAWIAGTPCQELAAQFGWVDAVSAASRISQMRQRHPDLFPYRHEKAA